MSTTITELLEERANSMDVSPSGFQKLGQDRTLVMGTPGFTVTIATYALISSIFITTTQTGGPERSLPQEKLDGVDGASMSDLLKLHES
ncbi:hypothetical protein LOK55_04320 [Microbacterium sp. F2E]|uniref:hypothetical protein n=1 Tax=Microbacterium sp. F2E TaxID=2895284 RepID=UPI001E585E48|nr:hypothetical protein [Microbacterium sp. F2E]MCC9053534.1 hypothetical protein [Microbacterium sp. F2E]